ncbi:Methyltransferase domain-containing protein [Micromonospora purpureochromogenes]|uniref:site-specific DNA-methyltransferase (adenine-specific) n=2 Tax=Micromonospora purpureochromogenes TaxID=47872 RepID=A0A1C5AJM6_9ACTN|nr:Methyltransferase domain-containing protein [Micromonospora purpureochromogenes]
MSRLAEGGSAEQSAKVSLQRVTRQFAPRHQINPSESERFIRRLASWCRANRRDPMPKSAVPGPTEKERGLLAALGGVAGALLDTIDEGDTRNLPPTVVAWASSAPRLDTDLLNELRRNLERGLEPLAEVYERLVAAPRRRPLGTFFTPPSISTYMTELVKSRGLRFATVADPGAGVGAFTRSALEAWPNAHVHAIDVNVVTLGLLAATPAISSYVPNRLSLHDQDFLEWLFNGWKGTPGPRLIWGNPPYTRHQGLKPEVKLRARAASGNLAPGGRAGLSTYFLAASLANLAPQDSLCLLLPSNWLEAEYAQSVREYLWRATRRPIELHIFPHGLNLFPVASVAAMVIWVGPETGRESPLLVHRLEGHLSSGFRTVQTEARDRVGIAPKSFLFSRKQSGGCKESGQAVELARLVQIRRGVATGANRFFLLTDDQVRCLPPGTFVPAATRLRDLASDTLDHPTHDALGLKGDRRWLLWLTKEDANDPAVSQLIDLGKFNRVHESYLCSSRDPWYAVERIPAPDLLFGPMAKGRFRIIRNDIGAIPTNTFYGITFRRRPASMDSIEILGNWIRGPLGQRALSELARQHGGGTLKIEPRDLAQLQIPVEVLERLDRA